MDFPFIRWTDYIRLTTCRNGCAWQYMEKSSSSFSEINQKRLTIFHIRFLGFSGVPWFGHFTHLQRFYKPFVDWFILHSRSDVVQVWYTRPEPYEPC